MLLVVEQLICTLLFHQAFISQSFEGVTSISQSLALLSRFKAVMNRDLLRVKLDSKLLAVFLSYGQELEAISGLYEAEKNDPPVPRNQPPGSCIHTVVCFPL